MLQLVQVFNFSLQLTSSTNLEVPTVSDKRASYSPFDLFTVHLKKIVMVNTWAISAIPSNF